MTPPLAETLPGYREFLLASLLLSYPDKEVCETLRELSTELETHAGAGPLLRELAERGGDDLASRYIETFDRGKERVSLYETEYGRMSGLNKGNGLADVQGFYAAFGYEAGDRGEAMDHAAVELEFFAILLWKLRYLTERGDEDGIAIVRDAQAKFLRDHLGRFLGALAARDTVQRDACYGPVTRWCDEIVRLSCLHLEVVPPPLDFFAESSEEGEVKCGGLHLPMFPR